MIKCIIFDFGNVIAKFDNFRFLDKIANYCGHSAKELHDLVYYSEYPKLYEMGKIDSDEFYAKICEMINAKIPRNEFIEAYTNIFTPIQSTYGLIKILKKDYKIALLSNTSKWDFDLAIKKVDVYDLFDAVTTSFEVGVLKPDPKIYQDCLDKIGFDPEECVFIDDIKEYAEGATKVGINGIQYTGHNDLIATLKNIGVIGRYR